MKVSYLFFIIGVFVLMAASQDAFAEEDFSSTINIFKDSPQAKPFFEEAYGYAVFPVVGEGAAVIGGAYGKGQMYQDGKVTGKVTLFEFSIGPQVGGQAYSEIIFFKDKQAYDEFTKGKFKWDAQASVIAVTASADVAAGGISSYASAATSGKTGTYKSEYNEQGVAVLVHGKGGLMAEASVGGQNFSFTPTTTSSEEP